VLRAAAIGGGAYVAGKRRQEAQQRELDAQGQAQTAPASGAVSSDAMERLKQLGELHEQGVLSDEEFAEQKARLLGG
jgi:hypothetical protein